MLRPGAAMTWQRIWLRLLARVRRWLPDQPGGAVTLRDPIGGALRDAEILMAFAAQSRRSLKTEKTEALAKAIDKLVATGAGNTPVLALDSVAFWHAYDSLALDMAPLSAHSIRTSMHINGSRFPASLLTPIGINAFLAIGVFFICLA